jgi:hypothetical protein
MKNSRIALGLAGAAAVGALAVGGATLANAEAGATPATSSTASSGTTANASGPAAGSQSGPVGGGQSQDTPVTGTERSKIEAVVKAKDSGITIDEVRMDPDGSYDVLGTSGGQRVFYDVSKDLATVTLNQGTAGGGRGGSQGGAPASSSGSSSGSASANG